MLAAFLLISSPFLLYVFKLFPKDNILELFGVEYTLVFFNSAQIFIWTLMQKVVPVVAISGMFFLFPPTKNEKFISIYWLVFPLFSIYLYQGVWILIDFKGVDPYFTDFVVWLIIITSIFTLAMFRMFLIQRETAFDRKLESIQGVLQQLRDEEIFKLFSNLYDIDVATGGTKLEVENAAVWRDKINDYALDGMKNINVILELLDRQNEELQEIEHQSSTQADLAF